jgi:hypothetical protein
MSTVMMGAKHLLTLTLPLSRSIASSDIGREDEGDLERSRSISLQNTVAHLATAGHPEDLYCPGKLLHLQRKEVEGLLRGAQQFVLVAGKADAQFKFIALRNTLLTDHRPVNILVALESLASRPVEG